MTSHAISGVISSGYRGVHPLPPFPPSSPRFAHTSMNISRRR